MTGPSEALIDKIQIQQVLMNLMRNAVEAMASSERRELTVTTARVDTMVEITIADTGPGLPEEMLNEVFKRFFRHDDRDEGSGLGLSIARALADRLNGSISLKNRTDRSGLIATIRLPVA